MPTLTKTEFNSKDNIEISATSREFCQPCGRSYVRSSLIHFINSTIGYTVEPRLTATSVIRSPRYYGHLFSARQNRHAFPHKTPPLMRSLVATANGHILKSHLLYAKSLPDVVKSSRVATFADDTKISKTIVTQEDSSLLQADLRNLASWSSLLAWPLMNLNVRCNG